jgi:hypothetical protein
MLKTKEEQESFELITEDNVDECVLELQAGME